MPQLNAMNSACTIDRVVKAFSSRNITRGISHRVHFGCIYLIQASLHIWNSYLVRDSELGTAKELSLRQSDET